MTYARSMQSSRFADAAAANEIVRAVANSIIDDEAPTAIAIFDGAGTSMLWSDATPLPPEAHAALRTFLAGDRTGAHAVIPACGRRVHVLEVAGLDAPRYAVVVQGRAAVTPSDAVRSTNGGRTSAPTKTLGDHLGAVANLGLGEETLDVVADGMFSDVQRGGNFR
jgi:hypothetical protein